MAIVGRDSELVRIDAWLGAAASSTTAIAAPALLLEGEPGVGKTTVWSEALAHARDMGVWTLTCRPSLSEAVLSYQGMADLLDPVADALLADLPPPQRRPLEVALLRVDATHGDLEARAVAVGLTAVLRLAARDRHVLLAVDDVQWFDAASARALAFAMRRIGGAAVRLLLTARTGEPGGQRRRSGVAILERDLGRDLVERMRLAPMNVAALHHVLRQELGVAFARPMLVRVHRVSLGNPFYALEIAREVLARGTVEGAEPLPVPANHRDVALLRVRRLPRATRDALLAVAALARPSVAQVDVAALEPAERAGIVVVEPSGRIGFTHPLFGSALYASATAQRRRALHRHLAARAESLEERARHGALGADGADAAIAETLDAAAAAAAARGAPDLAVELAGLARRLTPADDPEAGVRRDLQLADRRYFAGDASGARQELERSLATLPPGDLRAEVLLELGSVVWTQGDIGGLGLFDRALADATSPKLRARIHSRASAFAEDCDVALANAQAALTLLDQDDDPFLYAFALHNMALWKLYAGGGADDDAVARGMELQRDLASWEMSTVPAFWARNLDQLGVARERFEDLLRAFREHGDEASTCGITAHLALVLAMMGRLEEARTHAEEAVDLAEQTGQDSYLLAALAARGQVFVHAGNLEDARTDGRTILDHVRRQPDLIFESVADAILGSAALAAGDMAEADRLLSAADAIEEGRHCREPAPSRFHGDHVEAVIELGDLDRAASLIRRMEHRARTVPRPWIVAVAARSSGLLRAAHGDLDGALEDLGRALEAHDALEMPVERGRTLLAIGRVRRRRKEKRAADASLRAALDIFETTGSRAWAARTRLELARVGGRARSSALTETEEQVAALAASGRTNREIGDALFLSPKTVEVNLTRVYRKLGVRSRSELAARFARRPGEQT